MQPQHLFQCYGCDKYFHTDLSNVKVLAAKNLREKDDLILLKDSNMLCDACGSMTPEEHDKSVYDGELVVILAIK